MYSLSSGKSFARVRSTLCCGCYFLFDQSVRCACMTKLCLTYHPDYGLFNRSLNQLCYNAKTRNLVLSSLVSLLPYTDAAPDFVNLPSTTRLFSNSPAGSSTLQPRLLPGAAHKVVQTITALCGHAGTIKFFLGDHKSSPASVKVLLQWLLPTNPLLGVQPILGDHNARSWWWSADEERQSPLYFVKCPAAVSKPSSNHEATRCVD